MYRAGIYCRVSVEERVKEGEYSNSICSQVKMGEEYIKGQQDATLVSVYRDDGVSGSHFCRQEFRRMLADIEQGKINMVILKDVSRLGRDHIGTGYYLSRYFPEREIRVVSLLDHYDSRNGIYNELMDIKTLMNNMYLRDTSRKIRAVIQLKRSMGEYTGKEPPYGYVKSKASHNHLETDPYAAGVVKRIYHMYLEGLGDAAIARRLNKEGILCPSRYKKEILERGYVCPDGKGLWSKSAVGAILKNPVYTGAVILPDTKQRSPSEGRKVCEDAHEAVVSRGIFEQIQQIRRRKQPPCFCQRSLPHKYAGLLYCGKCGYAMRKRYSKTRGGYAGYMCGAHQEAGQDYCEQNYISLEELDELTADSIHRQMLKIKTDWTEEQEVWQKENGLLEEKQEKLKGKIERNQRHCKKAYEQYVDKVLGQREYLERKSRYEKEREGYLRELASLEQEKMIRRQVLEERLGWLRQFQTGRVEERKVTGELLKTLIERIDVCPGQRMDIFFRFDNPLPERRS